MLPIMRLSSQNSSLRHLAKRVCVLRGVTTVHEEVIEQLTVNVCRQDTLIGNKQRAVASVAHARESSDNPMLNAFCRVAPSVRLRVRAILPAGVFFRASDFSSRTFAVVQARLLDALLTMCDLRFHKESSYSRN
jgi:hypothetical protein